MLSPKGSSKHSLVTYNSDISDDEHHRVDTHDNFNDISDLMSISPATMDSSVGNSNEPSPKEKFNVDEIPAKKFKKPISSNSLRGLVSYGMDEDDSMEEDDGAEDLEPYNVSLEKDSSLTRDDSTQNPQPCDNEEYFNNESRESDNEIDCAKHDKPDNDLKSHSGLSSSQVKASVLTERPKGSDLAYLLSRQIYNNPDDISLPPPSSAKPSAELEQKIADLRAKALNSRCNPTEAILKNKAYRNPSIYEKLIQHMKIDERGTNYPPELYDPYRFGEESYYEVLAKNQDSAERKRIDHEANGAGAKISKASTLKPDTIARKTKWDSGQKPAMAKAHTSTGSTVTVETKTMFAVHK